ncbi:MAG: hypothetical protein LBQ52_05785 [Helicobacteraceae bacterium]|jgi:hypothetical protein|nr:hypothetical protein [Helicobacteraceae bacterium]
MLDRVYCVLNYWDGIVSGVAGYRGEKYYFERIFDDLKDDWSDEYNLTYLNDDIFLLELENWRYWRLWKTRWSKDEIPKIPHPLEYKKLRETTSYEEIVKNCENKSEKIWRLTEQNYQNDLIIDRYLKEREPSLKLKGVFIRENIEGNKTKIKWSSL